MVFWIRVIAGVILGLGFVWVSVMNWTFIIAYFVCDRKHRSWVPCAGGAMGVAACVVMPFETARQMWWVPLVADWGCVLGSAYTVIAFALGLHRKRRGPRGSGRGSHDPQ